MNIIEDSYKQMNLCISTFFGGVASHVNEIIETLKLEDLILNIFFLFTKIYSGVSKVCIYTYDNSEIVRYITKNVVYSKNYVVSTIQFRRLEPIETNWISISTLNRYYYTYNCYRYNFSEVYEFSKVYDTNIPFVTNTEVSEPDYKEYFETLSNTVSREIKHTDGLVIMKSDDNYVHRVCNKNSLTYKNNISYEQSEIKFLSVVYSSKNKGSIYLELKRGDYLVNNELFSSTYIKRLLEYQHLISEFDINYVVKIIDNNIKNIELKNNQYIILGKTDYEIVTHDM